ncbi:MAG TPA: 4Fe-4S binding protein [Methanobacterium sp.]|jgi:ferredoxin|nr:4Fe-4S binding protein [Methanobacterium sp.]HOI40717.1 4Fe-4S binding protein [Methanobacterium sp.]
MIISAEKCGYCGACVAVCPQNILELWEMKITVNDGCEKCDFCLVVCPLGAIKRG